MALDAFGRLRTSQPFTTFDYYPSTETSTNLDQDIWYSAIGGTATQTYNTDNYILMTINNSNDYCLRLTKSPMEYQPGKSRLIFLTGVLLTGTIGSNVITSRVGLFNVDTSTPPIITDGTYFQTTGTILQWCESISSLSTVTSVNQSSWNIDTFDGNGPSGKTLSSSNLSTVLLWVATSTIKVDNSL